MSISLIITAALRALRISLTAGALACALGAAAQTTGQGGAAATVGQIIQIIGQAHIDGQQAQVGAAVQVGQRLSTAQDGYLYIQTIDQGYIVVRPGSVLRIPDYHVDTQNPGNSRFKLELEQGVARSISGKAVPAARNNFRFNTPVAAIGVLGTDFTVFTDQDITRISVSQGGVVVSALGQDCVAQGYGPCAGSERLQLLASQIGQILQVQRGSIAPELLSNPALAPDAVVPPSSTEPGHTSSTSSQKGLTPDDALLSQKMATLEQLNSRPITPIAPIEPPASTPQPQVDSVLQWGRWSALAKDPANLDLAQAMADQQLVAINSYFAVLQDRNASWVQPQQGSASFALQSHESYVMRDGKAQAAGLENGHLTVDFGSAQFKTGFDIVTTDGARFTRQASGAVGADGSFGNSLIIGGGSNMTLNGTLAQPNAQTMEAAYLYSTNLGANTSATGVTYWRSPLK